MKSKEVISELKKYCNNIDLRMTRASIGKFYQFEIVNKLSTENIRSFHATENDVIFPS